MMTRLMNTTSSFVLRRIDTIYKGHGRSSVSLLYLARRGVQDYYVVEFVEAATFSPFDINEM